MPGRRDSKDNNRVSFGSPLPARCPACCAPRQRPCNLGCSFRRLLWLDLAFKVQFSATFPGC